MQSGSPEVIDNHCGNQPVTRGLFFRRRRIVLWSVALGATIGTVLTAVLLWFSPELFLVESPPRAADAIIVLGGGLEDRARHGAKLFREGFAPLLFVTGHGDCAENVGYLRKGGVPDSAMRLECNSRSTMENIRFIRPMLREAGVHRALLVTTWFHSRRALATFRAVAPEVEFVPTPTHFWLNKEGHPMPGVWSKVAREYLKVPWYFIRHGISPRLEAAPVSAN
jgi:uncharacterized SAM-binding protein YcdF (DUF218 family)